MTPDPHAIAQQKAALHALIDTIDSPEKLADLQAYATGEPQATKPLSRQERLKLLKSTIGTIGEPNLSAEQLRRKNIYDE